MESKEFETGIEYLLEHSGKLSKYAGRCIAVVKGKLIAEGENRLDAYKKARDKYPKERIAIFYIPKEEETVPLL